MNVFKKWLTEIVSIIISFNHNANSKTMKNNKIIYSLYKIKYNKFAIFTAEGIPIIKKFLVLKGYIILIMA